MVSHKTTWHGHTVHAGVCAFTRVFKFVLKGIFRKRCMSALHCMHIRGRLVECLANNSNT